MLEALGSAVRRMREEWGQVWRRTLPRPAPAPAGAGGYQPLEKLVLTDGVGNTLFRQYAEHRQSSRGEEETGWMLMGIREETIAIALATLPAGMECEAGVAHVRFNSTAQALASRILRQDHRRLGILGVVHTHPGSLRHPSNGDYQGDRQWVALLRGEEGVFGIGTADGEEGDYPLVASQPKPHSQCFQGCRFSWYALAVGDRNYRPLPVELTIGPDLAQPLHLIWPTLEAHAERLDRLCQQLARVRFEIVMGDKRALHVVVPIDAEESICVILREAQVTYCLLRKEQLLVSDCAEPLVDRGVYLLLAGLAAEEN
jgi:proteasome lid subunit RPN8/RPN11